MPTPGQELSSIDFESMLGGPLIAVVNAQAQSSMASVNFIKEVGFTQPQQQGNAGGDTETGQPIYVKFKYQKELAPYEPAIAADNTVDPVVPGSAAVPAKFEAQELEVPILTMLPIPFIRIEETTIDFNAKINSVEYRKSDSNLNVSAALEAKAGWMWGSAKLKVSTSYQRSSSQGNTVNRSYSMAVHIKAVQDEMPAGMERVLGILEGAISAQPVIGAGTTT